MRAFHAPRGARTELFKGAAADAMPAALCGGCGDFGDFIKIDECVRCCAGVAALSPLLSLSSFGLIDR